MYFLDTKVAFIRRYPFTQIRGGVSNSQLTLFRWVQIQLLWRPRPRTSLPQRITQGIDVEATDGNERGAGEEEVRDGDGGGVDVVGKQKGKQKGNLKDVGDIETHDDYRYLHCIFLD